MKCLRCDAIMFYNYFRNARRLTACALRYTRDHPCLHFQYLLSRAEDSAHALTCRLRKISCILCLQLSARTPHGTAHSKGPPYTSVVFNRVDANLASPSTFFPYILGMSKSRIAATVFLRYRFRTQISIPVFLVP